MVWLLELSIETIGFSEAVPALSLVSWVLEMLDYRLPAQSRMLGSKGVDRYCVVLSAYR